MRPEQASLIRALIHRDQLADKVERVKTLHRPIRVYDEREDSFQGYACYFCCFQETDYLQSWCPHGRDHWEIPAHLCCPTREALEGETQ